MKAMKYRHLTLCDSYEHSQVIPKKNAKRIFEKIVQVYTNREDIDDRYKSSNYCGNRNPGNWWTDRQQ